MSEVIVVAGMEYPKYEGIPHNPGGWALHRLATGKWRQVALLWAARELRTPGTVVTIFDMAQGTVERQEKGQRAPTVVARRSRPIATDWRVLDESSPGTALMRRPADVLRAPQHPALFFAKGSTGLPDPVTTKAWKEHFRGTPVLGMQDVYDHICDTGRRSPKSIRGLHIFSHAWSGGPILCNSRDFVNANPRDFYDTDGRLAKDFLSESNVDNLPPIDALALRDLIAGAVARTREWFDAAWSDDVRAVVWGCDKDPLASSLIHGVVASAGTAATGDPLIRYTFGRAQDWGMELERWQDMFGVPTTTRTTTATVRLTLVKELITKLHTQTYAFALRRALGPVANRPRSAVCTAPLGTSTMIDSDDAGPQMAMSVAGDHDKLTFYRNVMGFRFAVELGGRPPFGRGYISFG